MTLAERIRPFVDTSLGNLAEIPKRILLGWIIEAEEMRARITTLEGDIHALRAASLTHPPNTP